MKFFLFVLLLSLSYNGHAQVEYGSPKEGEIPVELAEYRRALEISNFPKNIHPVLLKDEYYWKHNTAVLGTESDIEIIEYGAYLYYNNQWNLRRSYPLSELKDFGIKNTTLLMGEPYTWTKNWRVDSGLYGGYAMWYFIGINDSGETVCGYEKIYTSDKLLNQ